MTTPQGDAFVQLQLGGLQERLDPRSVPRSGSPSPRAQRGPKGARVGDVIVAEGSRWLCESVDPVRREAICRLVGGSRVLRRFRARAIRKVERTSASAESLKPSADLTKPHRAEDSNP
jgi:hypothetical protein